MPNRADEFREFWERFPRKVGKLAAEQSYEKARRRGVTQEQLLDGVERYKRHKPGYADWCHPKTWLNQGRWDDSFDEPVTQKAEADWYEECGRMHNHECGLDKWRHITRRDIERQG